MAAAGIRTKFCELCGAEAHLHCAADAAFLCRSCDAEVHASNFLVARHVRRLICRSCRSVTGNCMSGPVFRGRSFRCKSCSSLLSSSSSPTASSCSSALDCVSSCELSSTDAGEKRRRRRRKRKSVASRRRLAEGRIHGEADGVFVKWCEKLGLEGNSRNAVVSSASWALALCLERLTPMLPFRLSLAASFWFGVRASGNGSEAVKWQNLKRVEELSGVPGKVIVAVGIRLARALRLRRWRLDTEEGWAESGGAGA